MKPVLIITRPALDGARFAREVAVRVDVQTIVSPLQKIEPVEAACDADAFVFTSGHGVAQAARLGLTKGRAWCVGDRTAQAAREAGFDAVSAGGNAEDLLRLILADKPMQTLAHLRGRNTRGDIAPRLTAAGVRCADVITYDQIAQPLSQEAIGAIMGVNRVIIPVFSPRAASLLIEQVKIGPHVELIAMSQVVSDSLGALQSQVLDAPNGRTMLEAVIASIVNVA